VIDEGLNTALQLLDRLDALSQEFARIPRVVPEHFGHPIVL
jgi:hypothetical protein